MDSKFLDSLIVHANDIYDNIHKNSNILQELLNIECINYNISIDEIKNSKNNFIDNMTIFIDYLKNISFLEIDDYTMDQLINILSNSQLEIFKLKNLYNKNINTFLRDTEKEMYECIKNKLNDTYTYNKIEYYTDIYKNDTIMEFFYNVNNVNNLTTNKPDDQTYNQQDNQTDNQPDNQQDNNKIDFNNEEFTKIIKSICDKYDVTYIELEELYYTLWNKDVKLYEFKNNKTFDYIYVYFDLYNRDDKTEKLNLFKIDKNNKKICINFNFEKDISESEHKTLSELIEFIISNL
jgi:hypothetical protein